MPEALLSDYLDDAQLATEFGVSRRTLRRWQRTRPDGIPRVRVGRRWLYRRAAVSDWLIGNERRPNPRGGRR